MNEVSQVGLQALSRRLLAAQVSEAGLVAIAGRHLDSLASQVGLETITRRSISPLVSQVGVLCLVRMFPPGARRVVTVTYDLGYENQADALFLRLAWIGSIDLRLYHSPDNETWEETVTEILPDDASSYQPGPVWEVDTSESIDRYWRIVATCFYENPYSYNTVSVLSMFLRDHFGGIITIQDPLYQAKTIREDYEISADDRVIFLDCVSPISVTLPKASSDKRELTLMKIDSDDNDVSIVTRGTDTSEVSSLTLADPFTRLYNTTRSGWVVA